MKQHIHGIKSIDFAELDVKLATLWTPGNYANGVLTNTTLHFPATGFHARISVITGIGNGTLNPVVETSPDNTTWTSLATLSAQTLNTKNEYDVFIEDAYLRFSGNISTANGNISGVVVLNY